MLNNFLTLAFSVTLHQWRLDRGAKREVRQWNIQTEKDKQEKHWGGAQSASTDINKQRQVTVTHSAALPVNRCTMLSELRSCLSVNNRLASESVEADLDVQLHCSSVSEAEPEKVVLRAESPPLASAFGLSTSFEEDVLDLKWRQSHRALLCSPTPVLSPLFYCFGFVCF